MALDDVKKKPSGGVKKKAGRPKKTTHSSGMYRKRITLGHDSETGKPIVKAVYGKSQDELKDKIAKIRVDRGMGVAITDSKSTWKYWADAWLKLKLPTVGSSAATNYKTAVKHLSPLNFEKVSQVTSVDVESIIANMDANGYSKRTLKLIINTASQISRLARKNHAMMLNVTEDVKAPKDAPVTERKAITPEEEALIWNVKPIPAKTKSDAERAKRLPQIRMFALMQLNCGLRREEAAALEWKNVDLKNATVTIDCAYDFKAKKVKAPKSKSGYRTIPIPDKYLRELKVWKESNKDTLQGRTWVFTGSKGIITEGEFLRLWGILLDAINGIDVGARIAFGRQKAKNEHKKAKKVRLNMPRKYEFTSHQLRHTFATNCNAKGIDMRTIQYLMGHSTPEMSMQYTHLTESALSEAREKMNHNLAVSEQKEKN